MFLKWLPWRYIASRLAKAHGFLDPIALWARLEQFAQPSEVAAPMELIRAGAALHARGLINTKVIQQNLDWVWPWWVERQFDPKDASFLPRAFSLTHVNLTHRNWTAVGLPDCQAYPLVDPRGLCTPFFDGWSLDAWLIGEDGTDLLPSRHGEVRQSYTCQDTLSVETICTNEAGRLVSTVSMHPVKARPMLSIQVQAQGTQAGWLVVALRPFNSEGVSFVHEVELLEEDRTWRINEDACLRFDDAPDKHITSDYSDGDVYFHLRRDPRQGHVKCKVGLATAAACFSLEEGNRRAIGLEVDLCQDKNIPKLLPQDRCVTWPDALSGACAIQTPDEQFDRLYRQAAATLVLLSPEDCYPGPFTYRRFWFRDAAFLLHALLRLNLPERCRRSVGNFPRRQRLSGFFHSQAGEWDSNGQVLWLLEMMETITGKPLGEEWEKPVLKAARWIQRKRITNQPEALHNGLLPAGFSAEHLGNNDYYYWDDFWAQAGLEAAARMARRWDPEVAWQIEHSAAELARAIDRSLEQSQDRRDSPAVPASPYRRMDAGAVGSLACSYPLELWQKDDPRILATAQWLAENCLVDGLFFQQMIHSGLNAYLTLHLAQVLGRAGRRDEAFELVENVANIASQTGQWPEAVHPRTGGGCMGDGQHAWASAEWILMLHNMFLRKRDSKLVFAAGLPERWLQPGCRMSIGPAGTEFGPVELSLEIDADAIHVAWKGQWHNQPPELLLELPGVSQPLDPGESSVTLPLEATEVQRMESR